MSPRIGFVVAALVGPLLAAAQPAPPPAIQPLQVSPVTGDASKELVLLSVTLAPGSAVPHHTHPGDCVGSVVEGTVELQVAGQPPRRISAGEAYANLRGTVHGFRNVGDRPARLLNNLFVDKGAPRSQPAPN